MTLIVNFALALLLVLSGPAAANQPNETAERTVHLLEYVAVDYPGAVVDGRVVSDVEYQEQLSFVGLVGTQLAGIGVPANDPLMTELASLRKLIDEKRGIEVVTAARALAAEVRQRF